MAEDSTPLPETKGSEERDEFTAKQLRNRYFVAEEILQTERSYVAQLHVLIENYSKPLSQNGKGKARHLLTPEQHQLLFGGIEVIYNLNLQLLESLTACVSNWDNDGSVIGDIFIKFGNFFKLYNNYCNSFAKAQKVLVDLSTHKHFHKFCESVRKKPESRGSSLKSLLITPIQRIPRYKLLLEQLLKRTPEEHPDRKPVKKALTLVEEVATIINEALRSHETHETLIQLKERFLGGVDFFAPSRVFVKQGGPFLVKARLNTVGLSGMSALDRSASTTPFMSQSSINSDALAASKHASTTTLPNVDENTETDTPEISESVSASETTNLNTPNETNTAATDGRKKRLQRSRDRMQLTIFLFNDLIVFAVAVHTKYKVFRQIPIDEHFSIAPVEHVDDTQKYALQVSSNQRKQQIALSVFFETSEELSVWTEYLHTFVREQTTAAIIRAVGTGSVEQTKILVENPAIDLNAQDRDGWTPLLYACHQGKEQLATVLLEAKCMIDLPNSRGETAFQLAFRNGRVSCVDVLLDHGASLLLSDAEGHTTLSVMLEGQMPHLAQRMVVSTVHRTLPSSRESVQARDPALSLSTTGARWPKQQPNVERLEALRRRITQEYVFQAASTGEAGAFALLELWHEASTHHDNDHSRSTDDCVVPFIDLDFLDTRAKVHAEGVRESPATVAAKHSHWQAALRLFQMGASPLFTNEARETPLHMYFKQSAQEGKPFESDFLRFYLLFLTHSDGDGHKEPATDGQRLGLLRMMCSHASSRVNFNVRDTAGLTPIMRAYNAMNVKAFTLLLPVSDLLLQNPDGMNLLHLASSQGFAAVVEELLALPNKPRTTAKEQKDDRSGVLAELAQVEKNLRLLQGSESHLHLLLFNIGGLMHEHSKQARRQCAAVLTAFFALGTTACEIASTVHNDLLALVETYGTALEQSKKERDQLVKHMRWLHRLVSSLRNAWQEYLPNIPVALTEGDIRGYRPRHLLSALSAILPEISQQLRGMGASVKAPGADVSEVSVSEAADSVVASSPTSREAQLLVSKDKKGRTALMLAAEHNRIKTVKLLLSAAVSLGCHDELLTQKDSENQTSLHIAASHGHEDVALYLASEGADSSLKDGLGFSAFDYACRAESRDLYTRLQAIVLHQATDSGNIDLLRYLSQSDTDLNAVDEFGRTPLMHACIHNKPECVSFFLERHCDPLIRDSNGWTALMHATHHGSFESLERFLSAVAHGLDVGLDLQTPDQSTSIMLGVRAGKVDCVSLLLTCGADPTAECNGKTAVEMATSKAMQACLQTQPNALPSLNTLLLRIRQKLPGMVTTNSSSRSNPSSPRSQAEAKAGGGIAQQVGSPGAQNRQKRFFTERVVQTSKSGVRLGRAQTGIPRQGSKQQDENCVLL